MPNVQHLYNPNYKASRKTQTTCYDKLL